MSYYHFVLRLFRLSMLYIKTSGNDRTIVKERMQGVATETDLKLFGEIPADIEKSVNDILFAYKNLYSADSLVEENEAEQQIEFALNKLKVLIGIEGTEEEIFQD